MLIAKFRKIGRSKRKRIRRLSCTVGKCCEHCYKRIYAIFCTRRQVKTVTVEVITESNISEF